MVAEDSEAIEKREEVVLEAEGSHEVVVVTVVAQAVKEIGFATIAKIRTLHGVTSATDAKNLKQMEMAMAIRVAREEVVLIAIEDPEGSEEMTAEAEVLTRDQCVEAIVVTLVAEADVTNHIKTQRQIHCTLSI